MTIDEMTDVLDRLGIETVGTRGSEIQGFCPGHVQRTGHEDKNPSWYINADTGAHICFSCQFRGSLLFLICFVQGFLGADGYEFDKAKTWLGTKGELGEAFEKATKPKPEVFEEVQVITEASLAAFTLPPEFALKSRGLTQEAAQKHGLLWDARRELWILTIRDPETNKILGWQEKSYRGRYFRNYPTGVQKSKALYGLPAYTGGDMIVVESPLDVVRLESVGISGGVATYGSLVSNVQVRTMKDRADRIIVAMDNDEAGNHSAFSILHSAYVMGFECWFFDYSHTDMKDVGGMSKREILAGIENARHSTRYASWFDESGTHVI